MKDVNKWLKSLDEKEISGRLKDYSRFKKVPESRDSDILEKIEKSISGNVDNVKFTHKSNFKKTAFGIMAAAAVFITCFFIFFNNFFPGSSDVAFNEDKLLPVYYSGVVSLLHNNKEVEFGMEMNIVTGDNIQTGSLSECRIRLDESHILIKENSKLALISGKTEKKANEFFLENGRVIISIEELQEDKEFIVHTNNAEITAIGTLFSVETKDSGISHISLEEGKLKIIYYTKDKQKKTVYLDPGREIIIGNDTAKEIDISPETGQELRDMLHYTGMTGADNIDEPAIDEDILPEDTGSNDEVIEDAGMEVSEKMYENRDGLFFKLLYAVNDLPDSGTIGLAVHDDFIIGESGNELICFNKNGSIAWQTDFSGKGYELYPGPVVFKNSVLVFTSKNKIMVYDIYSGKELQTVNVPGNAGGPDFKYCTYNDKIIAAFSDGLYLLFLENDLLEIKKIFSMQSPEQPSVIDNIIYCFSSINNELYAVTTKGNNLWSVMLFSGGVNSVVGYNGSLFTGDNMGYVYKISPEGNIDSKVLLSSAVCSGVNVYNNYIYVLTESGTLYKLNPESISIENTIKINLEIGSKNTSFLIKEDMAVIGTDKGEIISFNLVIDSIQGSYKLSGSGIISPVYMFNNEFITSTASGEIYMFYF